MLPKLANFINNEYVPTTSYIESFNPAIGKPHLLLPDSTTHDVHLAVNAAKKAFPKWSTTTRQIRSQILQAIATLLESRLEEFAIAESRDQGKPVSLATSVDITRSIHNFRFFSTYILHLTNMSTLIDGIATNFIECDPVGVAALISPWNLPLYLLTWKIAPCIAYGCTAVCKPSEFTSHTAFLLCDVMKQAGLPPGVVNMVFGTGPGAGQPLVEHPEVRLVSFTGGTVTGARIAALCAPAFKKVSLELGGKNANIIFADADFEKAVETSIKSSFANQGEICLCGSRIYVQDTLYDRFLSSFVEKTRALVVGDPCQPSTNLGALVSSAHLDKIQFYVDLAVSEGGTVQCGGKRLRVKCTSIVGGAQTDESEEGYFFAPTIITGLTSSSRVCQEEIFGPVVTVIPFSTELEAINHANDSPYGLSCTVWTRDGQRARRVARSVHVGTVWINCWMVRDLNCPFGGQKASGLGRESGTYSREFFCEEKTVCMAD